MESDKVSAAEKAIAEFDTVRRGSIEEIGQGMDRLDRACARLFPTPKHAQWREMIEIGLVAAVVAWGGIRTFFLQPFKIPTGSMQPTLYGIHIEPMRPDAKVPMLPLRLLERALFGRSYIEAVCEEDGELASDYRGVKIRSDRSGIGPLEFPKSVLTIGEREYGLDVDEADLRKAMEQLNLRPGRTFRRGEPIVRCKVTSGDHIFVDKVSYNFRRPRRGEVFVFETRDIPGTRGEFYIKRLAGVGGDRLRIKEPQLFVNGKLASEPGFTRVMTLKDGYHGYTNAQALYLRDPGDTFAVEHGDYFALGDNSQNSADSRYFGRVPHANLVGRAMIHYWPFTGRFGQNDVADAIANMYLYHWPFTGRFGLTN
ncbi:MAG: signal peptidase I [Verrucomicrobia bacterium]|nr:signal peptidase I [Verrucomicrobiota bacterium]